MRSALVGGLCLLVSVLSEPAISLSAGRKRIWKSSDVLDSGLRLSVLPNCKTTGDLKVLLETLKAM